jgi:hypothetical protein
VFAGTPSLSRVYAIKGSPPARPLMMEVNCAVQWMAGSPVAVSKGMGSGCELGDGKPSDSSEPGSPAVTTGHSCWNILAPSTPFFQTMIQSLRPSA